MSIALSFIPIVGLLLWLWVPPSHRKGEFELFATAVTTLLAISWTVAFTAASVVFRLGVTDSVTAANLTFPLPTLLYFLVSLVIHK